MLQKKAVATSPNSAWISRKLSPGINVGRNVCENGPVSGGSADSFGEIGA